jgi:hypothetical protein
MKKTSLGLTRLAPGESLSTDNYSFQDLNPRIIDQLLRYAALLHRHDAHVALQSPIAAPFVTLDATGGSIPSDTDIYVGYTLTDQWGGETDLVTDPVLVSTQPGLSTPIGGPEADLDHVKGSLLAGTYTYAITATDGLGGQTPLGPTTTITIPTGFANSEIVVSGMDALADDVGGTGYRLWRRVNGGTWGLISDGATAEITDDGTLCVDCTVVPPTTVGRTLGTSRLHVAVPHSTNNDSAQSFSIYGSTDGTFSNPALLGTYPIAALAADQVYDSLAFADGAPPEDTLALPGASQVDALTDIIHLPIKPSVAQASNLPSTGNDDGDLRVVRFDNSLHVWSATDSTWHAVGGGGTGGAGPIIQDEQSPLPLRDTLDFQGPGVTVTDGGASTIVTIPGGSSGGLPARQRQVFTVPAMDGPGETVLGLDMDGEASAWTILRLYADNDISFELHPTADARDTNATPPYEGDVGPSGVPASPAVVYNDDDDPEATLYGRFSNNGAAIGETSFFVEYVPIAAGLPSTLVPPGGPTFRDAPPTVIYELTENFGPTVDVDASTWGTDGHTKAIVLWFDVPDAPSPLDVRVVAFPSAADWDAFAYLYREGIDAPGTELISDDNGAGNLQPRLNYTITTPGRYYVLYTGKNPAGPYGTSYFTLRFTPTIQG